jgi:hypothetical protein
MEGERNDQEAAAQSPEDGTETRRPSLAERLMNPQPVPAAASTTDRTPAMNPQASTPPTPTAGRPPAYAATEPAPAAAGPAPRTGPEPPAPPRQTTGQRSVFTGLRPRSSLGANEALKDARRFVRVRYYSFLASMVILLAAFVIGALILGISRLNDGPWEVQAVAGAVAGGSLLLLIALQYRPAAGFATAAAELAQLEALESHLDRSYALWDAFLEDRESKQQVMANEVALAVSSMTAATRDLVAAQADFVGGTRARRNEAPARAPLPSQSFPDPRRYQ